MLEKVQAVYGLTIEEIRELQSPMSIFYDTPFFNGWSLWTEVSDLPAVQKLQGNDWMLTCIMRQQAAVASLSVAGGIILSLESAALNISKICEWLESIHWKTSISNLEHVFNDTFGTRISTSKLAEKLKSSGSWEKIVTDSMDEYIDSLVDDGLSDMNADDLLREEFFWHIEILAWLTTWNIIMKFLMVCWKTGDSKRRRKVIIQWLSKRSLHALTQLHSYSQVQESLVGTIDFPIG